MCKAWLSLFKKFNDINYAQIASFSPDTNSPKSNYCCYICFRSNLYFHKAFPVQTACVSVWAWLQLVGVTWRGYCIGKTKL